MSNLAKVMYPTPSKLRPWVEKEYDENLIFQGLKIAFECALIEL